MFRFGYYKPGTVPQITKTREILQAENIKTREVVEDERIQYWEKKKDEIQKKIVKKQVSKTK